jgi:hypothetical protein
METPGGTGAATWQGNAEASKSAIARVPLHPRLTPVQKRSRPTPYGETTPIPLMTTRLGNPTLDNPSIGNRQSPIGKAR